ncbi:MAG: cation diffusion facilitator family transporter [Ferrimicrobium sp.]
MKPPKHHGPANPKRAAFAAVVSGAAAVAVLLAWVLAPSPIILANFAHFAFDFLGILAAAVAQRIAAGFRPSRTHTFGLARLEVVVGLLMALALLLVSLIAIVEGVHELFHPQIQGLAAITLVGSIGVAANVVIIAALHHHRDQISNRAAVLHSLGDLGAVLVTLGAAGLAAISHSQATLPWATLVVGLLVVVSGISIIRESLNILMEGVPAGVDLAEIEDTLNAVAGVTATHHLHVWRIGANELACSAHLLLATDLTLHDSQAVVQEAKMAILHHFAIEHATFEAECHTCAAPSHGPVSSVG